MLSGERVDKMMMMMMKIMKMKMKTRKMMKRKMMKGGEYSAHCPLIQRAEGVLGRRKKKRCSIGVMDFHSLSLLSTDC